MISLAGGVFADQLPAARVALLKLPFVFEHGVGRDEDDDCRGDSTNNEPSLLCSCHADRIPQLGVNTSASLRRFTLEEGGLARGIHDDRYRRLIEALYDARRKAGLSQTELAQRLGKRQQFVSKYESGERRLDVVEFVVIARSLNLDAAGLIETFVSSDG